MKVTLTNKFITIALAMASGLSASAFAASDSVEPSKQKVEIHADEISFPERSIIHFRGATQLIQGNQRVYADQLIYNKPQQTIEFRGHVKLESPSGDVVHTPVLHYDLNKESAVSGFADFVLRTRDDSVTDESKLLANACGTAKRIEFQGGIISRMEQAKIATCEG